MDVKLTIYSEEKERFSRVISLPCVIGRGKQCDVAIVHPLVSRRHCEIYEENGCVMTRDLGSLNGTFYHRTRIGRGVNIPMGDSFTIGKLHFKIEEPSDERERNAVASPKDVNELPQPPVAPPPQVELPMPPTSSPQPSEPVKTQAPPQPRVIRPDIIDLPPTASEPNKSAAYELDSSGELADDSSVVIDLDSFLASDQSSELASGSTSEDIEEADSHENDDLFDLDAYLNDN